MLKTLVATNLVTSGLHFLHNAVFLSSYPGPHWISNPWIVVVAWFVVAGALVLGYHWHKKGHRAKAAVAVSLFGASCLLVFGHYLYGAPSEFDALTNLLIFGEGLAGVALLVYFWGWTRTRDAHA